MREFIKRGAHQKKISDRPTKQQLYFLYKLIVNRTKIEYSLSDSIRYLLGKICVCCRRCKKSARFQKSKSNVKVFQEGKSKLKRDLDIVKLIQRSLESKVNSQVHYNPEERFLLGF